MKLRTHFVRLPCWMREVGLFVVGITVSTVAGIIILSWAVAGVVYRWIAENFESGSHPFEKAGLSHHNH